MPARKRTPEEIAAYAARSAARAELIPPSTNRKNPGHQLKPFGGTPPVVRSVRGYRRLIDYARFELAKGWIDRKTFDGVVAAARVGAELLQDEMGLRAAGVEDMEPGEHVLGDDGGFEPERMVAHRKKRIKIKRQTDKHGRATEVREISVETSADDGDAAVDAEVELLR